MSSRNLCWYWSDLFQTCCIILWMCSNFGQIGPSTTELAALERLRNTPIDLIMGKMVFPLFMPRHQKVARYYVIPSEILSVRPSVRLSVCLSVRPSVRPSVSAHHHSCIGNSSYSFRPILLKLYRCFKDGLKICILFFQNPEIIFYHFFPIFNLDIFRALILQICIWSIYLVSATPPTVFGESFWNFTGVLRMVWRYAYCFFRILKLFFITFYAFLT